MKATYCRSVSSTIAERAGAGARISNLDLLRGVAVLGILLMNAVSYGLPDAAYFNLQAAGTDGQLDWLVGGFNEVFVDQKMMGLFSMLFGASIVLFCDRADANGRNGIRLSLWRNTLLLGIGLVHSWLWEGDVLVVYALCAPALLIARRWKPRTLVVAGVTLMAATALLAAAVQTTVPGDGAGLRDFWTIGGPPMSDAVGLFLLVDFFGRALAMMLLGVASYRLGVIQGSRPPTYYRRLVASGFGVGIPLAVAGLATQVLRDFEPSVAVVGEIPNTLATIPMTVGYLGLITSWNLRPDTPLRQRIRATGQMALTNYISQTVIGLVVLRHVFPFSSLTRWQLAVFVAGVWSLELAWSKPWLTRFRYGPLEWAWRSATYLKREPFQREDAVGAPRLENTPVRRSGFE